ncbi:MAG: Hpt domain-containing protein [Oscillospiraceae bacterium]|jgi:HPt (histidine-containing phosphotransfer) domain-containing protein|nr:Hpt domain-containing protein [Oscillospiraceae bacterium]
MVWFEREQKILDDAAALLDEMRAGRTLDADGFAVFVGEYGSLLEQLRRAAETPGGVMPAFTPAPADGAWDDTAVDKPQGLLHTGGNEKAYDMLLVRFLAEQPVMLHNLEQAAGDGDHILASGIARQMKGIAATIGAVNLPRCLSEIERAFMSGLPDGRSDELLEGCRAELRRVLSAISMMNLPDTRRQVADEPLDLEKALALIRGIKPLLEKYISLSQEQIGTVRTILAPVGEACGKLAAQLEDFDLEEALETLCGIEEELIGHGGGAERPPSV